MYSGNIIFTVLINHQPVITGRKSLSTSRSVRAALVFQACTRLTNRNTGKRYEYGNTSIWGDLPDVISMVLVDKTINWNYGKWKHLKHSTWFKKNRLMTLLHGNRDKQWYTANDHIKFKTVNWGWKNNILMFKLKLNIKCYSTLYY